MIGEPPVDELFSHYLAIRSTLHIFEKLRGNFSFGIASTFERPEGLLEISERVVWSVFVIWLRYDCEILTKGLSQRRVELNETVCDGAGLHKVNHRQQ